MRESTEIFIPIPKSRNAKIKVELDGDDLTGKTMDSLFRYPVTKGIGTFKMTISNASGQLSGKYAAGNAIKFYADNSDGTTLQFWGRVDYVKEIISDSGQVLEIEGRHRAYTLTEYLICYSATEEEPSQILKDIIGKLPSTYGFTSLNVVATETSMNVQWNYKPFWDCVREVCNYAGFDCYVDNDLDFHFFEANSISNTDDAIVEGDNLINSKGWGTNDYYEKTRVVAIGQSEDGLPIVYTAISSDEGTEIREVFIKDVSSNTETSVKNLAEAKLSEITNRTPEATVKSFGLETIKPGDNIWLLIPRQQVHGQYKLKNIIQKFGTNSGGWRTELSVEQEEENVSHILNGLNQTTSSLKVADNINKLNYSWYFGFDATTGTHSSTEITEGVLKSTGASGTWISNLKEATENATSCEIRVKGQSIPGTLFYVSIDNGRTYQSLDQSTLKTLSPPGANLRIKVEINSADTQIYSMVLLYT